MHLLRVQAAGLDLRRDRRAGRKPAEPIEYFNPGPRQAGDPKPPEAKPGTVQVREVAHGDWCDLLNRRGPCNCDPETRYVEVA